MVSFFHSTRAPSPIYMQPSPRSPWPPQWVCDLLLTTTVYISRGAKEDLARLIYTLPPVPPEVTNTLLTLDRRYTPSDIRQTLYNYIAERPMEEDVLSEVSGVVWPPSTSVATSQAPLLVEEEENLPEETMSASESTTSTSSPVLLTATPAIVVKHEETKTSRQRKRMKEPCRHSCGCRGVPIPKVIAYRARHERSNDLHPACSHACTIFSLHLQHMITYRIPMAPIRLATEEKFFKSSLRPEEDPWDH